MIRSTLLTAAATSLVATTALSAPKKILVQEFTATWCPHCRNTADGVAQLMAADPDTIVGMMLHVYDAYETPLAEELVDFYGLPGQPIVWVDGYWHQAGSAGNGDANAQSIGALVDQAETTTDVVIDIVGQELASNQYAVDVTVSVEGDGQARDMRVYVSQVYSDMAWPETNETQFNTERQSAPTQQISLQPGESWSYGYTFTLTDESLDTENVNFIVWAQDDLAAPPAMIRQVAVHGHGDEPPCDCPGDLDCSNDVGVDDLLAALAAWDGDGGDADGDGDTDVDDILTIISGWGPC